MGHEDDRERVLVMFGGNNCDLVRTASGCEVSSAHTSGYDNDDDEND